MNFVAIAQGTFALQLLSVDPRPVFTVQIFHIIVVIQQLDLEVLARDLSFGQHQIAFRTTPNHEGILVNDEPLSGAFAFVNDQYRFLALSHIRPYAVAESKLLPILH